MPRHETSIPRPPEAPPAAKRPRSEWHALAFLLPYLWEFRGRVLLAFALLLGGKLANVGVPLVMKEIVDLLSMERALVTGILLAKYEVWFTLITAVTLVGYIAYTVAITEWRTKYRRQMNEQDSRANSRAIDSLINYETVKYFGNEEHEARRYDENRPRYESAAVKSQTSLSALNVGQTRTVATGVTLGMWRAPLGV